MVLFDQKEVLFRDLYPPPPFTLARYFLLGSPRKSPKIYGIVEMLVLLFEKSRSNGTYINGIEGGGGGGLGAENRETVRIRPNPS